MQHNIRDIAVFKKIATVSRESNIYELVWYLDLELQSDQTIINALLKNINTGEYIKDAIAPECMGYCSVGSYFKGGKKLETRQGSGVIRDITIDVSESVPFDDVGAALRGTGYDQNFIQKSGSKNRDYAQSCKKQKCMVFQKGTDKVVIPCFVIAATFYLTSSSMRTQLFAQNLEGLYEAFHFDESTKTALIILHRNARTEDAKRIARFAISKYAKKCWNNVMNAGRELTSVQNDTIYTSLTAKIPVIQDNLKMNVRCHELPNADGGTTTLVHEIRQEWTELPFDNLLCARRGNAPLDPNVTVSAEKDAKSNGRLTNRPPSRAYKGHFIRQFNVPYNPLWEQVTFEQITLPSLRDHAETTTVTEKSDETVELSPQASKGSDPEQKVAKGDIQQEKPKAETVRMALSEFREMVAGFEVMAGVTDLFMSSNLEVPLKGDWSRDYFTLRESYDGNPKHRRHYTYATFGYKGEFVCLVEIDQTGISTHVGTFVMTSATPIGATEAELATSDYVKSVSIGTMEDRWADQDIFFTTKSHPTTAKSDPLKKPRDNWPNWTVKVLEMVG